jgi:hypothetical protein
MGPNDQERTNVKQWDIGWRSAEIYGTQAGLRVYEVPWWALAIEHAAENFDHYVLRHRWCSPPEWMHRIPLGRPKRDEDGYMENSLGYAVFSSFNWVVSTDLRHAKNCMDVDLTDEWLEKNGQVDPLGDDELEQEIVAAPIHGDGETSQHPKETE